MPMVSRWCSALLALGVAGCHLSDVLKVPIPAGVTSAPSLANQAGAEAVYAGAKEGFFDALYGPDALVVWTELLTDEFTFSAFTDNASQANIDARQTAGEDGFQESGDAPWQSILTQRSELINAVPGLQVYEPSSRQSKVGEAYALIGYTELFVAESYCGGTPLSQLVLNGGLQYGMPLTDDSILMVAEGHFDSALAHAGNPSNDTVLSLASVGLGRVLLDRGRFDSAASAVQNVSPSFVYNAEITTNPDIYPYYGNLYDQGTQSSYYVNFNVANLKGQNGLDFLTANDPRLTFNTSYQTQDGDTWYLPAKFVLNLSYIPIATGVEAALIQAEVALQDGNITTWLTELNTLRNGNSGCSDPSNATCALGTGQVPGQATGLYSLTDPGTDTGRISLQFRERAFWLYGTGSRLEDLRRLMRAPYDRDSSLVFPRGPYPNGTNPSLPVPIQNYGTDVNLTLPTAAVLAKGVFTETNPNYRGCITSTKTP